MSLTLELPSELETRLSAEAERLGVTLEEHILHLLSGVGSSLRDGRDLVAYWKKEGLIGTRPDIADAPAHARRVRKAAERRNSR
jgi:hypothetical protein